MDKPSIEHQHENIALGLSTRSKFLTLHDACTESPSDETMVAAINFARLYGVTRILWSSTRLGFTDEMQLPNVLQPIRDTLKIHEHFAGELYLHAIPTSRTKGPLLHRMLFELICTDHEDGKKHLPKNEPPEGAIRA